MKFTELLVVSLLAIAQYCYVSNSAMMSVPALLSRVLDPNIRGIIANWVVAVDNRWRVPVGLNAILFSTCRREETAENRPQAQAAFFPGQKLVSNGTCTHLRMKCIPILH